MKLKLLTATIMMIAAGSVLAKTEKGSQNGKEGVYIGTDVGVSKGKTTGDIKIGYDFGGIRAEISQGKYAKKSQNETVSTSLFKDRAHRFVDIADRDHTAKLDESNRSKGKLKDGITENETIHDSLKEADKDAVSKIKDSVRIEKERDEANKRLNEAESDHANKINAANDADSKWKESGIKANDANNKWQKANEDYRRENDIADKTSKDFQDALKKAEKAEKDIINTKDEWKKRSDEYREARRILDEVTKNNWHESGERGDALEIALKAARETGGTWGNWVEVGKKHGYNSPEAKEAWQHFWDTRENAYKTFKDYLKTIEGVEIPDTELGKSLKTGIGNTLSAEEVFNEWQYYVEWAEKETDPTRKKELEKKAKDAKENYKNYREWAYDAIKLFIADKEKAEKAISDAQADVDKKRHEDAEAEKRHDKAKKDLTEAKENVTYADRVAKEAADRAKEANVRLEKAKANKDTSDEELERLAKEADKANKEAEEAKDKANQARDKLSDLQNKADKARQDVEDAKERLKEAQEKAVLSDEELKGLEKAVDEANKILKDAKDKLEEAKREEELAPLNADVKYKLDSDVTMANIYYDFHNDTNFTPYVMGGLGIAHNSLTAQLGGNSGYSGGKSKRPRPHLHGKLVQVSDMLLLQI